MKIQTCYPNGIISNGYFSIVGNPIFNIQQGNKRFSYPLIREMSKSHSLIIISFEFYVLDHEIRTAESAGRKNGR